VEQLPNVNSARRFANQHRGRVFLASYALLPNDMLVWGDDLNRSDRRTAEEDRSRYTVNLNQYKMMQAALYRLRDNHCLFPDPDALEQEVLDSTAAGDTGAWRRIKLVRDWVWMHFTKTALVVEQDEETRKPRARVQKIGLDPHFSFANMLCDAAWAREQGAGTIYIPTEAALASGEGGVAETASPVRKLLDVARPAGVPADVRVALAVAEAANPFGGSSQAAGTCAGCIAFTASGQGEGGHCDERGLSTGAREAACPLYVGRRATH
jgi:hypothetical protein